MTWKPMNARVIVKPEDVERITPGGLHLPDNARRKPQCGVVRAVGARQDYDPDIGDRVMWPQYAGVPLEIEGETHLVLKLLALEVA